MLHSSVPFPQLFPAEKIAASATMNLQAFLKISMISQSALHTLYSAHAATQPWSSVQESIQTLSVELEQLLPVMSDCKRLILHFQWCDTMILVTRPCLFPRTTLGVSEEMSWKDRALAEQCIKAAQTIGKLLPEKPDSCIFQNGPWWCLVHYIMRALSVMLLSSSHESLAFLVRRDDLAASVKKLVDWLGWLQAHNVVAKRGLEVALEILRRAPSDKEMADTRLV